MTIIRQKTKRQQRNEGIAIVVVIFVLAAMAFSGFDFAGFFDKL